MDLRKWTKKLNSEQQAQPLVSHTLPNGSKIKTVTEEIQATKKKQSLLG